MCHEADGQISIRHKQTDLCCKVKHFPEVTTYVCVDWELGWMTFKSSFQPKLFYDSVKICSVNISEVSSVDVDAECREGKVYLNEVYFSMSSNIY